MRSMIYTTLLFSFFLSYQGWAQDEEKVDLTIRVKNLQNKDGQVMISLVDKEEDFMKAGIRKIAPIEVEGEVVFVFKNLRPGSYAASVIHDENNNRNLDTAMFGIPTEPYGFSNDARGSFGPPSYDDCLFPVHEDTSVEINLE